jgi:hypothetical protein
VSGLLGTAAIAAGYFHSLALLSNGTVEAWGFNPFGQLGNGTTNSADLPVPVNGLSGASGVSAHDNVSFALLGPTQTLSIALVGAGAGAVGGPAGILCPSTCSAGFPQGAVETMRAAPTAGSGFAGFSGACTGTGLCRVTMGQDQSVSATFGPPKGTQITHAKINSRKKSATFLFAAPGAITGFECMVIRPSPRRRHHGSHKRLSLRKRPKPHFTACSASGKGYKHLLPGRYAFEVRALDILGADVVPATQHFKIKLVKQRKHKSKH